MERRLVQLFRELGYSRCLTSRLESKARDYAKVDLCHTGIWNVQSKAVEGMGSAHSVLASMPEEAGQINVVFHKKSRQGTIVSMTEEDFVDIVKLLIKSGAIKPC